MDSHLIGLMAGITIGTLVGFAIAAAFFAFKVESQFWDDFDD